MNAPIPDDLVERLRTIGTSALVYPAAALPGIVLDHRHAVVEIHPDETPFSRQSTWSLRGKAGIVLPALVDRVWHEPG